MKRGRGRAYPRYGDLACELAYLVELHARAMDLVVDLPEKALNADLHGHSIRRLLDHMIEGELSWIGRMAGIEQHPPVSTCAELDRFTPDAIAGLELDSEISVGPFTCVGQVLRHLQWHWSHHSAQIGVLRKALGYEYVWTFE